MRDNGNGNQARRDNGTERPAYRVDYQRLNSLLNGPLSHPLAMFQISRLARCLTYVVEMTGEAAWDAFQDFCLAQQQKDDLAAGT